MGVDEAFQKRNLGRRLYRKLEEELLEDGVRMVIADTEGDNEEAISFFKAIGFSPRSEHIWLAKTLRKRVKEASKGRRVKGTLPETVEAVE
jgi:ribosomal protein S18 acetylase RimI-like enzyme